MRKRVLRKSQRSEAPFEKCSGFSPRAGAVSGAVAAAGAVLLDELTSF